MGHAYVAQQRRMAQHAGLLYLQKAAKVAQHGTKQRRLLVGRNGCFAIESHLSSRDGRKNPGIDQERDQRFDVGKLGTVAEAARPIGGKLDRDSMQGCGTALLGQLGNIVVTQPAQYA